MPASLPGSTLAQNQANPTLGAAILMDPFSGPKGSPFDNDKQKAPDGTLTSSGNCSTGALSTGIGFGSACKVPGLLNLFDATDPTKVTAFSDNYQPGLSTPAVGSAADASYLTIGGGKSVATPVKTGDYSNTNSVTTPYVAQPLLAAGNGGSRDAGAGPAFTGFGMKVVTAAADVAAGGVIETGFTNRSGVTLPSGLHQFGVSTTASPAVT